MFDWVKIYDLTRSCHVLSSAKLLGTFFCNLKSKCCWFVDEIIRWTSATCLNGKTDQLTIAINCGKHDSEKWMKQIAVCKIIWSAESSFVFIEICNKIGWHSQNRYWTSIISLHEEPVGEIISIIHLLECTQSNHYTSVASGGLKRLMLIETIPDDDDDDVL